MEPVFQDLGVRGLGQSYEDVTAEAGRVLDPHGAGPLDDVLGVSAADGFEEEIHGLVAFDAVEVEGVEDRDGLWQLLECAK